MLLQGLDERKNVGSHLACVHLKVFADFAGNLVLIKSAFEHLEDS